MRSFIFKRERDELMGLFLSFIKQEAGGWEEELHDTKTQFLNAIFVLHSWTFSLSPPAADGSLCAVCRGVCRSGEAEESNPGGAFPGACCGAHPPGPGDVYSVSGGHGRIPPGQQDPAAHGENERGRGGEDMLFVYYIIVFHVLHNVSCLMSYKIRAYCWIMARFHIYVSEGTN